MSTGTVPAGPFEDLAAKKKELANLQALVKQAQSDVEAKQAEVQAIESFLGDTEKIVQAYATALPKSDAELQGMRDVVATHKKEVNAVLGEPKVKAIDEAIKAVDTDIAAKKKAADDAATEAQAKQAAADAAAAAQKQAEANLAALKKTQASLEDMLKPLRALRDQEAKADAVEGPGSNEKKAVFVLELERAANSVAFPTADELRTKLLDALKGIDDSKKKVEQAKTDAAAAKKTSDDAAKAYSTAAAARIDTIIAEVAKL